MSAHTPLNRVDTTIASAGTGKTTTLVGLLADAIDAGVPPERILGTTFTKKAASHLIEQARSRLIEGNRLDEATQLLNARLGTINAVCGRLVSEFAFELGRSPSSDVIPEESAAAIFAMAADDTIASFAPSLNALAESFGLPAQKVDWREQVLDIIDLARANGIATDDLIHSANRSVDSLLALLPVPDPAQPEHVLDDILWQEVNKTLRSIDGVSLDKGSFGVADAVRLAAQILRRGDRLPWSLWAKLTKNSTKGDKDHFAGVQAAASVHPGHPRLRRELEEFIRLSFECAAQALSAYQAYKAERGLLDFVDQEALTLEILRRPDTQERLRELIGIVFVDEVQDASPLQVAIFTELARIVPRSVWVGDPKQSIYAFRSTDPSLTLAACRGIAAGTGGKSDILSKSWRSRPGICEFVNDAFVPAFEAIGLPKESSTFTKCARDDAGFTVPPLSVWHAKGKNQDEHALSLAGGIVEALATPSAWPISGPAGMRDLGPGDIAVLCRSNDGVEKVASALSRFGVPVAVERGDLFRAEEIELATAALRWTSDRGDRLALAEMARLTGGTAAPDAWLDAVADDDPDAALKALVPFALTLESLREQQLGMTPCEIVDAVILATGVVDMACRWGSASERLHRLEAFRGVACSYEQQCERLRLPATLNGLVTWLDSQRAMQPKSRGADAVQIMTYHKAKGLEWPVVILSELEKAPRAALFKPSIEVDGGIDWRDPLAGRWIRLWPWPYGPRNIKDVHLDASAPASLIGRGALKKAKEEAVRLLYVGATRARDHLVFNQASGSANGWIKELNIGAEAHVVLPSVDGAPILVGGCPHPARVRTVQPPGQVPPVIRAPLFLAMERSRRKWRPLRLKPSAAASEQSFSSTGRFNLGGHIPVTNKPEMDVLGQAVHAFLAVDARHGEHSSRVSKARLILERWGMAGHVSPESLIVAADRFWTFLDGRFPGAQIRREVPVHARLGSQVVAGRIDLLVETGDLFAIVDHKSFPGREGLLVQRAVEHGPQIDLYARAVAAVTGKRCSGLLVHMPLAGTIVEVRGTETASAAPSAG